MAGLFFLAAGVGMALLGAGAVDSRFRGNDGGRGLG